MTDPPASLPPPPSGPPSAPPGTPFHAPPPPPPPKGARPKWTIVAVGVAYGVLRLGFFLWSFFGPDPSEGDQGEAFATGACFVETPVVYRPVSCTQPHDAVLVLALPLGAAPNTSSPSVQRAQDRRCERAYQQQIGPPPPVSAFVAVLPSWDAWQAGDQVAACLLVTPR